MRIYRRWFNSCPIQKLEEIFNKSEQSRNRKKRKCRRKAATSFHSRQFSQRFVLSSDYRISAKKSE